MIKLSKVADWLVQCRVRMQDAVTTGLDEYLMERVSVIRFGADPTGVKDSTAAFQAALDACSDKPGIFGHGRTMIVPGGNYKITAPLYYTWIADTTLVDNHTRRLSIRGDGSGCTFLNYSGPAGTTPVLTVDGGLVDPHLRVSISGMRIQRPDQSRVGWGVYFKNVAIMQLQELDVHWFDHGVVFHDVISCKIDHCQFSVNQRGMVASKLLWTCPNVFDLRHVMFSSNAIQALNITDGANFKLDTCTFEGNGNNKSYESGHRTIQYTGAPVEGGLGLYIVNSYFENNFVYADVCIESNNGEYPGSFCLELCSFQRTSPTRNCTTHVNLSPNSSGGKHRVYLRGNNFKFAGGYTHQSGDSSVIIQTDWVEMYDQGNVYHPMQAPQYQNRVVNGYDNKVVCTAQIAAGGAVVYGHNVASVAKGSTGVYSINFKKALTSGSVVAVASTVTAPGRCIITGYSATGLQVTVQDSGGNATDAIAFNLIATGIML